jgi:DNA-binding transcriptional LysR family regulator
VAQPALSQQILRLERELGVELLARTRRRVALTEAGRLFLAEARRTLRQAEEAVAVARRAAAGEVGRLRIGYVDSALWGMLPAALRTFRERHPGVALSLRERLPVAQVKRLEAGAMDVGIGPPAPEGGLASELIEEEPYLLALPAGHRQAGRDEVALAELAGEPWIVTPARIQSRARQALMAACAAAGFVPRVRQVARQMDAIVALVGAGLGLALVPASARRAPREGVVLRPLRGSGPRFTLAASWRRADPPPTVEPFLAVLREVRGAGPS